jgi:hypothetical protein
MRIDVRRKEHQHSPAFLQVALSLLVKAVVLALIFLPHQTCFSQGWLYTSDSINSGAAMNGSVQVGDGHYLVYNDAGIVRFDSDGRQIGYRPTYGHGGSSFGDMIYTRDKKLVVVSWDSICMMDTTGVLIWCDTPDTTGPYWNHVYSLSGLLEDNDGNFITGGVMWHNDTPIPPFGPQCDLFLMKYSPSGTLLSRVKTDSLVNFQTRYFGIEQLLVPEKRILTYSRFNPLGYDTTRVQVLDSEMVPLFTSFPKYATPSTYTEFYKCDLWGNSGFILLGMLINDGLGDTIPAFSKINSSGTSEWADTLTGFLSLKLNAAVLNHDGDLILCGGYIYAIPGGGRPGVIACVDTTPAHNLKWSHHYGGVLSGTRIDFTTVYLDADSGYSFQGKTAAGNLVFLKTNKTGLSGTVIQGYVYNDQDSNCIQTAGENRMTGWRIELAGVSEPDTFYAYSDAGGNFIMSVDTGLYTLRAFPLGSNWRVPSCTADTIIVDADSMGTTLTLAIPRSPLFNCPQMYVDLSTPLLMVCQPSIYSVLYCNLGPEATTSQIEIEFDTALTVTGASVPFISLPGNKIRVNAPSLSSGVCDSFQVYTTLACSGLLIGETHCATARILPDTFCSPPDPLWDRSSLRLVSRCDPDSVRFIFENVGTANMTTGIPLIVVEDDVLKLLDTIQLPVGVRDSLAFAKNGSTWSCLAEQVPFHPGLSHPSAFQEGCTNVPLVFNTGYATSVPLDDGDLFIDIDCQQNVAPPVTRMKEAYPAGWNIEHFIDNDYELEYHIRFRNLGPDSIFSMSVEDTLPAEVDPNSIIPGASTFPYVLEYQKVEGRSILTFKMDRIFFPDSLTDPERSWGFVKFRASLYSGLDSGTVIVNKAVVRMFRRSPGITNVYYHTIHNMVLGTIHIQVASEMQKVKVYPNPSSGKVMIDLGDHSYHEVVYELTDVSGRILYRQEYPLTQSIEVEHPALASGIYFFRITSENQPLATGKIMMVQE